VAHTQALHRNANAIYRLVYHLVLVTKYRKKVLTGAMLDRASTILGTLCEAWDGRLLECSGEVDHLHALIDTSPVPRITLDAGAQMRTAGPRVGVGRLCCFYLFTESYVADLMIRHPCRYHGTSLALVFGDTAEASASKSLMVAGDVFVAAAAPAIRMASRSRIWRGVRGGFVIGGSHSL
jgi:hypothetical protein